MAPGIVAREALTEFGRRVRLARSQRRWTVAELAERLGVSVPTVRKVERGDPSVAIGTAFEAAWLTGVPLFDADPVRRELDNRAVGLGLALLPARVRKPSPEVDDDF